MIEHHYESHTFRARDPHDFHGSHENPMFDDEIYGNSAIPIFPFSFLLDIDPPRIDCREPLKRNDIPIILEPRIMKFSMFMKIDDLAKSCNCIDFVTFVAKMINSMEMFIS